MLRNLHGNHAAALLNLDDWAGAVTAASAATELDSSWSKGHYRLGCALESLAEDAVCCGVVRYVAAIEQLEQADGAFDCALAVSAGGDKGVTKARNRVGERLKELRVALGRLGDDDEDDDETELNEMD